MLTFLVISVPPPLRTLAALSPLELHALPPIVIALALWLMLVRLFWRLRLIERFLEVDPR